MDSFDMLNMNSSALMQDYPNFENSSFPSCSPESPDCPIDHTKVCVGDYAYCNLTEEEYRELLVNYITPSISEWILVVSHICVFFLGLVSFNDSHDIELPE